MAKIHLKKDKDQRTRNGHPWIYRSDIERVEGSFTPGDIVDILDARSRFLGRGYYNPASQIAVRLMTRHEEDINADFFEKRLRAAVEYRKQVADLQSCRLVFGESDFLPALIVDKFADVLVMQTLSLGIDRWKDTITEILDGLVHPLGIYERNDVPVRELEGLEQKKGFLRGPFDTMVQMTENGVHFMVDVADGQKTGFFLDQKENRAAIAPFVRGQKVMDCFTHTGSFALHAGHYGAKSVLAVDISAHAVETTTANIRLNQLQETVRAHQADVFDFLREESGRGEAYDTIILDPPAFTKSRQAVQGAVRGYKEINLQAMKLLKDGGYLISCSCSHHMDPGLFMDVIFDAAHDARKTLRLMEYRTQAKDHPILLAAPETQYLKCAILQVHEM